MAITVPIFLGLTFTAMSTRSIENMCHKTVSKYHKIMLKKEAKKIEKLKKKLAEYTAAAINNSAVPDANENVTPNNNTGTIKNIKKFKRLFKQTPFCLFKLSEDQNQARLKAYIQKETVILEGLVQKNNKRPLKNYAEPVMPHAHIKNKYGTRLTRVQKFKAFFFYPEINHNRNSNDTRDELIAVLQDQLDSGTRTALLLHCHDKGRSSTLGGYTLDLRLLDSRQCPQDKPDCTAIKK